MKILMRNIGMTLHVIHTLRAQGIDNVKVNMDWQHLIMNGENLAEYAALLAAEGLLGHQHANSGWGTFDDDNMVGATAFMETLELAVELRRAGYGDNGERLGFDLYPYTEDAVGAVKRSVLQWRFIDGVAAKIDERRAARGAAARRTPSGRTSSSTPRSAPERRSRRARRRHDRRQGASRSRRTARCSRRPTRSYPLSTPQPGWAEQDPEDWWRAAQACLARLPEGPIGLSGQMHGLVVLDADDRVLRPAILWNDQRTAAECAEIEARVGLERLIELTGNRALTGFTAPKLLWLRAHEPDTYARIRHVLLPKDYVRLRLTGEHAIDAADASGTLLFDVAGRRWSDEVCDALEMPARVAAAGVRVDRGRRRGRPGGGRARRRHRAPGPRLGRARHVGRRLRGAARLRARPAGARARLLPRRARHVARDGRDAERGRLARLAARRARRATTARSTTEAARWAPGAEGLLFAPYLAGRAHAARRPGRARRVHRPLAPPRPRRALRARCSRASPTGCATRSSCCASSASDPRSGASRAAARAASSGCASSPRCSACRSSGPSRRRARRSAPRCSPACAPASSPTPPRRSRAACASATGSSPIPAWVDAYERGYDRYRTALPRPCDHWRRRS